MQEQPWAFDKSTKLHVLVDDKFFASLLSLNFLMYFQVSVQLEVMKISTIKAGFIVIFSACHCMKAQLYNRTSRVRIR